MKDAFTEQLLPNLWPLLFGAARSELCSDALLDAEMGFHNLWSREDLLAVGFFGDFRFFESQVLPTRTDTTTSIVS